MRYLRTDDTGSDNIMNEYYGTAEPPVRTNGATPFCLLSLLCHCWIQWEYPKVCVNLQTDVRYNYSVWRLFLWQEEKTAHKKQQ